MPPFLPLQAPSRFATADMDSFKADVAIIGAGGAGLRAAIAVAEANPALTVALVSKVYPMRSHTVAAEGGSAAVTQAHDSLEHHFHDTVAGGDWLCDQDVVDYFVGQAHRELVQMEHWGCPTKYSTTSWSHSQSPPATVSWKWCSRLSCACVTAAEPPSAATVWLRMG